MMPMLLLDILQSGVPSPSGPPPPFTVLALGKSLFSVSFCALTAAVLAVRAVWRANRSAPDQRALALSSADASLFWGGLAFAVGLFHTFLGLTLTSITIRAYAPVEPALHRVIAGGVAAALGASAYGLLVLVLMALFWLGFRNWHRRSPLQAT